MSPSPEPCYTPRFLMLTETERNLGIIPAAAADYPRGSPDSDNLEPYEIMTFHERVAVLDFHEAELEWFDWEFLSSRRSTNTGRGIEVIQRISGRIVCFQLYFLCATE